MSEETEVERLRKQLEQVRAALATTEDNKRELADSVRWWAGDGRDRTVDMRPEKRDFITDLLAVLRKRAGLEDSAPSDACACGPPGPMILDPDRPNAPCIRCGKLGRPEGA